ncbi:hypothetical protein ACC680_26890 [Rhizobium ruizarguesonis]
MRSFRADGLSYLVAGAAFGVIFVVLGYIAHAAGSGADGASSFTYWAFNYPVRNGVYLWFASGMAVGAGLKYAFGRAVPR